MSLKGKDELALRHRRPAERRQSTLFNALTRAGIAAENYPFCTIEPNVGRRRRPRPAARGSSPRSCSPRTVVPATVEFVDIAGLVRGRVQGRGARQPVPRATSARPTRSCTWSAASRTTNVVHVDGQRRSAARHRDDRHRARARRPRRRREAAPTSAQAARAGGDKEAQRIVAALEKRRARSPGRRAARRAFGRPRSAEPRRAAPAAPAHREARRSTSPTSTRHGFHGQPATARQLEAYAAKEGAPVVPICAKLEAELADLDADDKRRRSSPSSASTEPGPRPRDPRRLRAARAGDVLHRRPEGSARVDRSIAARTAPQAAGVIHTRFREGLHPRRGDRLRRLRRAASGEAGAKERARCASRARNTSSRTATSCTSGSTSEGASCRRTAAFFGRVSAARSCDAGCEPAACRCAPTPWSLRAELQRRQAFAAERAGPFEELRGECARIRLRFRGRRRVAMVAAVRMRQRRVAAVAELELEARRPGSACAGRRPRSPSPSSRCCTR